MHGGDRPWRFLVPSLSFAERGKKKEIMERTLGIRLGSDGSMLLRMVYRDE
jgi:hypothetical protein